jgi:hypothetical protein
MAFDAASFLLQWATGGLFFLWITTRRREVSLGYGWLLRGVYGLLALGSFAVAVGVAVVDPLWGRDLAAAGVAIASAAVLAVSVLRRRSGVSGHRAQAERRSERVAAMTGIRRAGSSSVAGDESPEFPPALDLIAPAIGTVGLVVAGVSAGGPVVLGLARLLVGALFLGAVTDAMLLGHWYLVQPGMARGPLLELVRWLGALWIPETLLLIVPVGMISVLNGAIDDRYGGLLGWFWLACALTTGGLVIVTRLALKERSYSAVMAATGLLYLAILTAFGTDLVARALLSGH